MLLPGTLPGVWNLLSQPRMGAQARDRFHALSNRNYSKSSRNMKKLWIAFASRYGDVLYHPLGWIGTRINAETPPIPLRVITTAGEEPVVADGTIERGQNTWQAMGGMKVGSVWGHGSYVAPN